MNNPYFDPTLQDAYPDVSWHPKQLSNTPDWSSAGIGALGLGLNAYGMSRQGLNLNQGIAPSQYDQNFAPSYTAGAAQNEAVSSRPQGTTVGETLGGITQGLAIGSEFGPAGAAAGAFIGGVSSIIGGESRAARQRKEREAALRRVLGAQKQYNTQDVAFRNQQNQRQEYLRRINPYNREYAVNQTHF